MRTAPRAAAAAALLVLACGRQPGTAPAIVRLISEPAQEILRPGVLGTAVPVLDGTFGEGFWKPVDAKGWRVEEGSLVLDPSGSEIELVRSVDLAATDLHVLEISLLSAYLVRPSLAWQKQGAPWDESDQMRLTFNDGRVEGTRRTFTFSLGDHPRWSGRITGLRVQVESLAPAEKLVVTRISGMRLASPEETLADRVRTPWRVELDDEVRNGLLVLPGLPVEHQVLVPENGLLRFAVGVTGKPSSTFVFCILVAAGAEAPSPMFETELTAASGRWRQASVDLGDLAGRRVRLIAETRVEGDYDLDLGIPVWANPEIVTAGKEDPRPNVILISIDTLRADHLSLYGYPHQTSPHLDAWGERFAAVFRNAVVQAPWTLPSHCSLLTGLDALRHGVNRPFRAVPKTLTTVTERLRAVGYSTAAITGGGWLHPHYGLDQGFDRYRSWRSAGRGDLELEAHVETAERWLGELREPFFLFLHSYDVHDYNLPQRPAPSLAPGDGRPPRVVRYDHAVTHMDFQMGRLLDRFESLGLRGRTIVALTSDHGEDLGEDGDFGHGSLRDPVLLVPLVIELPSGRAARTVVDDQVRSVDIVPTLLELVGAEAAETDGTSLVARLEGRTTPASEPSPAVSYTSSPFHGELSLRIDNRWKYVYDNSAWTPRERREALYRLPNESRRGDDVAAKEPQTVHLRDLAQRLLEERLGGLRLEFQNPGAASFAGILRGDLVRLGSPKSTDLEGPWFTRVDRNTAGFEVPPGKRFHLLFEHLGEPRFELEAAGDSDGRVAIDVETAELPATWRWTGSAWVVERSETSRTAAGVTVAWIHSVAADEAVPYEEDPGLRQQLEALGYLQ